MMASAQAIVANLTARGISLDRDGSAIVVRPAGKLTDDDRRIIREHKDAILELLSAAADPVLADAVTAVRAVFPSSTLVEVRDKNTVIEAVLRSFDSGPVPSTVKPQSFPPCPGCHQSRYWITPRGAVVCGSGKCNGATRFMVTHIELYAVQ